MFWDTGNHFFYIKLAVKKDSGQAPPSIRQEYSSPLLADGFRDCFLDVLASGMHEAAFFGLGRGGAKENNFGVGQGLKSSGRGGVTVKLRAFSGWGGVGWG